MLHNFEPGFLVILPIAFFLKSVIIKLSNKGKEAKKAKVEIMETITMAVELLDLLACEKLSQGTRRNYCVKFYDDTACLRTMSNTVTNELVKDVVEHHIRWIYFSKIKNARSFLKDLKKIGFKTIDKTK